MHSSQNQRESGEYGAIFETQENNKIDDSDDFEDNRMIKYNSDLSQLQENIYESIHDNLNIHTQWNKYTRIYFSIQILCLTSLFVCTLSFIILTLWVNLNGRFQLLTKLANNINYTSINKLVFGYFNYICIIIAILSLILDISQLYIFIKIRNFLFTYQKRMEKVNEKLLKNNYFKKSTLASVASIPEELADQLLPFRLRKNLISRKFKLKIKSFIVMIEFVLLVYNLIYVLFIISVKFLIGIWLERNLNLLVNDQLPTTLWKLLRQFEYLILADQYKGTHEEQLVLHMHKTFDCCHYINPYQYNTFTHLNIECNLRQACLKPIQYYFIYNLYIILIFLLINGSLNLLVLIFQCFNYKHFLIQKLLYSYKPFL